MRSHETEALIEPNGIWALFVRGQLHELAVMLARAAYCPMEELCAKTASAKSAGDPHRFDQATLGANVTEIGDEGQLQHAHDLGVLANNNQFVVWIRADALKRIHGGGIDRRASVLARSTHRIICQHGYELREISFMRFAKFQVQSEISFARPA